jgi:RNA polymerase sigma-70 factor (ECF subfamily)
MNSDQFYIELVEKAKQGEEQALHNLVEALHPYLYACVNRFLGTDNRNGFADDLVQEVIVDIYKDFHKQNDSNHFLGWVNTMAINRVRDFLKKMNRRQTVSLNDLPVNFAEKFSEGVIKRIESAEFRRGVENAMQGLKIEHQAILHFRCLDNMKYSKIAESMGRREFAVKKLFFRAKQAFIKNLEKNDIDEIFLGGALLVYGKIFSEITGDIAPVSIHPASLHVEPFTAFASSVTTASGAVKIAAGVLVAAGAFFGTKTVVGFDKPQMASGPVQTVAANNAPLPESTWWYYYPDDKAVMFRFNHGPDNSQRSQFAFMENRAANYFMDNNALVIKNHRFYNLDLSEIKLPGDLCGNPAGCLFECRQSNGALIILDDLKVLSESGAGLFELNPPASVSIVDSRDAIHKRGWTYFTIKGQIEGQPVLGQGQIPLVYEKAAQRPAWLKLTIGDQIKIVDTPNGASIRNPTPKDRMFTACSFLSGFSRPWEGLHSMDSVRRDAKKFGIPCKTRRIDKNNVEVGLFQDGARLIFTIDLEHDFVTRIKLDGTVHGEMEFAYIQDDSVNFRPPSVEISGPLENMDCFWLMKLAEGDWLSASKGHQQ